MHSELAVWPGHQAMPFVLALKQAPKVELFNSVTFFEELGWAYVSACVCGLLEFGSIKQTKHIENHTNMLANVHDQNPS